MEEQKKNRENVVAGVVGAFLGSLIGVVCTVVIGQLGYVAAISGLVMAVCALKGYELLGGSLSKKGVVVSAVLILAMTWFAHRLSWALALASALEGELTILESFRAIPYMLENGILESAPYWGDLVMLYLFTLLGAVPTVINGLRNTSMPEMPRASGDAYGASGAAAPEAEAVFYPGWREWTRPLRFSASLSVVPCLVVGIVLIVIAAQMNAAIPVTMAALGCILSGFVMIFLTFPMMQANQADGYLFVRASGTLWKVHLPRLNNMDTYRFSKKLVTLTGMNWESLPEEEQERAKASVLRAISLLTSGQVMPGSALGHVVLPLTDLQIVRENEWSWRGSYAIQNGRRKKITIPKCYSDFAPIPGMELCREPAPFQWKRIALGLALAVVLGALGYVGGAALDGGLDSLGGTSSGGKRTSQNGLTAVEPVSSLTYEVNGVSFEIDSTFEMSAVDTFQDPDTSTEYALGVQGGMDEESAIDRLLQPISDYRMSNSYESFSFAHVGEEDTLVPLTAADGMVWQYEILTVRFTTGAAVHEAVALSGDGVLVEILVNQTRTDDEDQVRGTILYMLESMQRTGSTQVEFGGPEITEENYQSLFHLGTELGYEQTAVGYIKAPAEMFGYDAFVDAHVPYSDAPEYLEDGTVLRSAAHGMEVEVTITPSDENAKAVVDAAYESLAASGADIVAEGVSETFFQEADDIAAKQAAYWEDNQTKARITILYADYKQDGFYLSAKITYFLEQLDDTYPELLAELCDAYGITLPEVSPMKDPME